MLQLTRLNKQGAFDYFCRWCWLS